MTWGLEDFKVLQNTGLACQRLTVEILMQVRSANATPFDGEEGFIFFRIWFGHVDDADIILPEILCCFHGHYGRTWLL